MTPSSEFSEVLRQLDSPAKIRLAETMPWPYNGMIRDVTGAIEAKANYLVALGLICYIEICGRRVFHAGSRTVEGWRCFKSFLDYIGAGRIMDQKVLLDGDEFFFHDVVRNGLVHEYFIRVHQGGVAMISPEPDANKLGFLIREGSGVFLVAVPLFNLLCEGMRRAQREGKLQ